MITPCYEIEELDAYRPAKPAFAEALCSNDSNPTCVHNCLCMVQGVGQIREVKNAVIRISPGQLEVWLSLISI